MLLSEEYSTHFLPNGIRLIFLPTKKFKTISLGLFIHQELNSDLAALNALLPAVLEQGCRLYPDYLTLQRELENLYGAELGTDIIKSGERHILAFTLETAHDQFLGLNGESLTQGMAILGAVVGDPLIVNGAFREDYLAQEKNQLIKDIRALLNDKAAYALERCLSLMCAEERFGIYKLGRIEDYTQIDTTRLYSYYRDLLAHNPIDLYIIGDLEEESVLAAAAEAFNFSRTGNLMELPATEIAHPLATVKSHQDEMTVNQTKLVIGFRTFTAYSDALYCPLLVYSGILGGFPHSKLFMKVREEAGLAYYIHTRLEQHKGLMVLAAGINYSDLPKARAIIDLQLEDMAAGNISDSELANTKIGLVNQLRSRQDSPNQLISFHLDGSVGGRVYSVDELMQGLEAVGREEIMAVAERVKLDTVYLLRPREGENIDHG